MNLSSVTASSRGNYESSKRQQSNVGQDLISNLPDFIIGHILSFLPTKDAVLTSILSQRWKYMWTFVMELSFEDGSTKLRKTRFVHFVYRVLLHLNNARINSFSLSIFEKYDSCHINEWISRVLNQKVKKIFVYSLGEIPLSSHSLFQSQSLEELVFNGVLISVPTFVSLSFLTVLKLTRVTVTCYPSNEFKELTLSFPVLRNFETKKCSWFGVKRVTLQVPLLEVLSVDNGKSVIKSNAEMKFCTAKRLTQFCYSGCVLSEAILLDTQIAFANITLYDSPSKSVQETRPFVSKLLTLNAECLKLYLRTQKVVNRVKNSFTDIPAFRTLVHLDLAFVTGEFLLDLLFKSPCLETLVLKVLDFGEELVDSATLPGCFLFTLKVVKFVKFAGTKHELSFAKYVMENDLVLEKITFSCCHDPKGLKKWGEVEMKLYSYKISFSSTIIEFLT